MRVQVVEAVGRTVEAWRRRPWGAWLSGGANRAEGGGVVQTGQDDEEWLLQEVRLVELDYYHPACWSGGA